MELKVFAKASKNSFENDIKLLGPNSLVDTWGHRQYSLRPKKSPLKEKS
jgi:hypothetical protein